MRLSILAVGWLGVGCMAALGQDYAAVTADNVAVRQAPGPQFAQVGRIPAGTPVAVDICFNRGAFCAVKWSAGEGYASGDLLIIANSTQTVRDAEVTKWANYDKPASRLPEVTSTNANIVVWGDSLSADTFGNELGNLLGRRVVMKGVGGDTGAQIVARRIATAEYDRWITIVWDRHYTGEDPAQYIADLAPLFQRQRDGRYVVLSDIRSMAPDLDNAADSVTTAAINKLLASAHPDNYLDITPLVEAPATRTDGLHLTPATYDAIAAAVAKFVRQKGW